MWNFLHPWKICFFSVWLFEFFRSKRRIKRNIFEVIVEISDTANIFIRRIMFESDIMMKYRFSDHYSHCWFLFWNLDPSLFFNSFSLIRNDAQNIFKVLKIVIEATSNDSARRNAIRFHSVRSCGLKFFSIVRARNRCFFSLLKSFEFRRREKTKSIVDFVVERTVHKPISFVLVRTIFKSWEIDRRNVLEMSFIVIKINETKSKL